MYTLEEITLFYSTASDIQSGPSLQNNVSKGALPHTLQVTALLFHRFLHGRRFLRSQAHLELTVPWTRTMTSGPRAFPVRAWTKDPELVAALTEITRSVYIYLILEEI